jgi:hypothetical protein
MPGMREKWAASMTQSLFPAPPKRLTSFQRIASRPYACKECGGVIARGERHLEVRAKVGYRVCETCMDKTKEEK